MSKKNSSEESKTTGNPTLFTRRRVLVGLGGVAVIAAGGGFLMLSPTPTMAEQVVTYKDPSCGCCGSWVDHMRDNGFAVTVHEGEEMDQVKLKAGIPEDLASCHTAYIGDYLVEGHVPASDIKRMLAERPAIKGLSVPGMPMDAPGMDGGTGEPYTVLAFGLGKTSVYASY